MGAMRKGTRALLASAAIVVLAAGCGSAPPENNLNGDSAGVCSFGRDHKKVEKLLAGIGGGASPSSVREDVVRLQASLRKVADEAGKVSQGANELDRVNCRRVAINALTALTAIPEAAADARLKRDEQARLGVGDCDSLSPSVAASGSAMACGYIRIYGAAAIAETEAQRVLDLSNRTATTVEDLDAARQSLERFLTNVSGDWKNIPRDGAFGPVRENVLGLSACTISVASGVLSNKSGSAEIDQKARDVARARTNAVHAAMDQLDVPALPAQAAACAEGMDAPACRQERWNGFTLWCNQKLRGG